jgi:high-affinity iron transporter
MSSLFDFAVTTIFAREFLEGSIIIGEYRTIVLRGGNEQTLAPGLLPEDALAAITLAALVATGLALLVIAAIAIPLAVLSNEFDTTTSNIIEGVSKIVAGISLLQLSLKLPKFLGLYGSTKKRDNHHNDNSSHGRLTLRSIHFNVAWNIWREVAECGVFLIPFFLAGDSLKAIPLSAVIGSLIGLLVGVGIYVANQQLRNKTALALFGVLLLVFLAAGLFTGGCHKIELEVGSTQQVWELSDEFWSVHRLPMTILKPFGYNDSRTVLEIACYWSCLLLALVLHVRKYRKAALVSALSDTDHKETTNDAVLPAEDLETVEPTLTDSICRKSTVGDEEEGTLELGRNGEHESSLQ